VGTGKNQLGPDQKGMEDDTPVLSYRSLLRNACTKPTGVLEHCREGKTNCCLSIFEVLPCDPIPKPTKYVNVNFFFQVTISVNCAKEFREGFEATTYVCISLS
jgi:hypothetical protein